MGDTMNGPKQPSERPACRHPSPAPVGLADLQEGGLTPGHVIANWPGVPETALHEAESRRIFQSTLARWAFDVLRLQRNGLDRPVNRHSVARQASPVSVALRKAA